MNKIKQALLFLTLFFWCENTTLLGMEESNSDKKPQTTLETNKKTKKKKNRGRKKNKKKTTSLKAEETPVKSQETSLYTNAAKLEELHRSLADLPSTLENSELKSRTQKESYLGKIHILTNLLVLLEKLSSHLENIMRVDTLALETVHKLHPIKRFTYSDIATRIDDNIKGCVALDILKRKILLPDLYFLESSEAKSATMQARTIMKSYMTPKGVAKDLPKDHHKITQFLELLDTSHNSEMPIVANWLRNVMAQQQRSMAIKNIIPLMDIIVFMNAGITFDKIELVTTDKDFIYNLSKIVQENKTVSILEKSLGDLYPFVQLYIPHIFDLLRVIEFTIKASNVIDPVKDEYFDFIQNGFFNTVLSQLVVSINENKQNYKALYSLLKDEQKKLFQDKNCNYRLDLLKKYSKTVLLTAQCNMPLPKEIFVEENSMLMLIG